MVAERRSRGKEPFSKTKLDQSQPWQNTNCKTTTREYLIKSITFRFLFSLPIYSANRLFIIQPLKLAFKIKVPTIVRCENSNSAPFATTENVLVIGLFIPREILINSILRIERRRVVGEGRRRERVLVNRVCEKGEKKRDYARGRKKRGRGW